MVHIYIYIYIYINININLDININININIYIYIYGQRHLCSMNNVQICTYIYIYGYWVQRITSTVAVRIWDVSACEWFFWWPHEMSASVFFCFHSWFLTCVPCLYLDRHVLRAAYLRRLDPPPHEYPVRELCFWLIFSKRKHGFGLHLDVGGAQGTLSTPYLVICHFSVGGAQGTLSTPYLVTCIFSVGGAQGTLSTPYLVTCHFSVGGAQGTLSTPYLVTCHFSVGGA